MKGKLWIWRWVGKPGTYTVTFIHRNGKQFVREGYSPNDADTLCKHLNSR